MVTPMYKKTIAVIDLKAFYSYVECLDRGLDPWTSPLIVADKERGTNTIVLSVSPYLKSKGIPSRCRVKELPKGFNYIYATPRMERYLEKSAEVVGILMDFVAKEDIHVYSIDEAFIDLTSYLNYYNKKPKDLVKMIMDSIKEKCGLQATAGIGDNFFLSKVALDVYAKKEKNGIAVIKKNEVESKIWPITQLGKIWSIGPKTEAKLNALGIYSMKDLANSNIELLRAYFGVIGNQLHDLANGIDDADIHEEYKPKETSLSQGQVLFKDYNKKEIITVIREMTDDLALRLRNENKMTEVVALFIGYASNKGGFSRQMSLLKATDDNDLLFEAIMEIFKENIKDLPIRNVGINFGKLRVANYEQDSLFNEKQNKANARNMRKAIDSMHNKYGKNIILRASALLEESTIIERHNQIGGHRK